jgi:hypothetical protein
MKTVIERIAETVATVVMAFAVFYFSGHAIAAWLRGAFQAVTR